MEKILANLDEVIKNIKNDFDFCMAITGRKRRGKSTLAYHISEYIAEKLGSKVHLCYEYKQLREAYFNANQYDVVFADETIGFLSSGKWYTPEAQEFIELFDRMGYKDLTTILIMPSFKSLLRGFREDRIGCHFWLPKRGMVWLYPVMETKEGCYFGRKPALIDTFPPLPPEKEEEYRRIKEESMKKRVKEMKSYGFNAKAKLRHANEYLRDKLVLTQRERAEIFDVNERTIKRWDKGDRDNRGTPL